MRPDKASYYLGIARQIARRGTCLRRNYGAVLVRNDSIVSTGYTGAPRETPNCIDLKKCIRQEQKIPPGKNYELCRSVHAEMNAIINAARNGTSTLNSTLFLAGAQDYDVKANICKLCKRMIINAGIKRVVVLHKRTIYEYDVSRWVKENKKDPFKDIVSETY